MRFALRIFLSLGALLSLALGGLCGVMWFRSYLPEIPPPTPPDAIYVNRAQPYRLPGRDAGSFEYRGHTYHWGSHHGEFYLNNLIDRVICWLKQRVEPTSGKNLTWPPTPPPPPNPPIPKPIDIRISYWIVVACCAPLPLTRLAMAVLKPRAREGVFCRKCGYDLRATPQRCPECGTAVPAAGERSRE